MTLLESTKSALPPKGFSKTTKTRVNSQYSELLAKVKEAGLLKRVPSFYIKRFIIVSLAVWSLWTALFFISGSANFFIFALAIPAAILLGVLTAQYGFIAHEAAHRQVFNNNKANDTAGLVLANGFAGLSYGFWLRKHNKHHQKPNTIGEDPDIAIRVLAFTPEDVAKKKNPERFITRNQGKLFPFLLLFTGFDLLLDSFASLGRKDRHLKRRLVEFGIMLVRQAAPLVFLFLVFPPIYAGVIYLAFMFTFGLFMGGAFAPNHKGMPLIPRDAKINFFQRQVLTSRNIKSSWLKDNLMGGLNFQVEHHLFPSMSRPHLRKAHEIVIKYCQEHQIPFAEVGLFKSYGIVIDYLNKVGLSKNSDPFVCPMVAELRPRN